NVPADFSVGLSPAALTVSQGQGATYTVTITRDDGFNDHLIVSAVSPPSGATVQFSSSGPLTMTVTTGTSTPAGTYTVTVRVANDSGSLVRMGVATLNVTAAASSA